MGLFPLFLLLLLNQSIFYNTHQLNEDNPHITCVVLRGMLHILANIFGKQKIKEVISGNKCYDD